jgi:hypothetical protein
MRATTVSLLQTQLRGIRAFFVPARHIRVMHAVKQLDQAAHDDAGENLMACHDASGHVTNSERRSKLVGCRHRHILHA